MSLLRGETDDYRLNLYIQQTLNFDTELNDEISYDIQENEESELTIYRNYNNIASEKFKVGSSNTTVNNNLLVKGVNNVYGNLHVTGDSNFQSNLNVTGNLEVNGSFTFAQDINVTGSMNSNDLTVSDFVKAEELRVRDSIITSNIDLNVTQTTIDYSTYNPYGAVTTNTISVNNPQKYQNLSKINAVYFSDLNYGDISISDIPAEKITHILVSFMWAQPSLADYNTAVGLGFSYSYFYDSSYTEGILTYRNKTDAESLIGDLKGLKEHYPHLKIMISIGGGSLGWNISKVLGNTTLRTNFVNSIAGFLQLNELDGIDIDWEYPTTQVKAWYYYDAVNDIPNFITFVQELRAKFDETSPNKYLQITFAAGNYQSILSKYNGLAPYVDYAFIMTYDYAGIGYNGVNPHTSLREFESGNNRHASKAVEFLNTLGDFPLNKICISVPQYGVQWTNIDFNNSPNGSDFFGAAQVGSTTTILTYDSIMNSYSTGAGYSIKYYVFDDNTYYDYDTTLVDLDAVESLVVNVKQVGSYYTVINYDSTKTVAAKTRYVNDNGLAGIFSWEITNDKLTTESESLIHSSYNLLKQTESNNLSFITNDVERLRITNSGNVGINTAEPSKTLDVNGDINFTGTMYNNGTVYGGGWQLDGNNVYNLNTGNIGIGTTNPISRLHIEGPDDATPPVLLLSNTSEDWGGIRMGDSSALESQSIDLLYNSSTEEFKIKSADNDNIIYLDVSGRVGINNNDPLNSLDVSGSLSVVGGNVGIGTNNPSAQLHIEGPDDATPPLVLVSNTSEDWGGIRMGDSSAITTQNFDILYNSSSQDFKIRSDDTDNIMYMDVNGNVGFNTSSPDTKLHIESTSSRVSRIKGTSIGGGNYIEINNNSGTRALIGCGGTNFTDEDDTDVILGNYTTGGDLELRTEGTRRMVVKSDGKVGINTDNPSEQLHVNGNAFITGGIVADDFRVNISSVGTNIVDEISGATGLRSVKNQDSVVYPEYKVAVKNSLSSSKTITNTDGSTYDIYTENQSRIHIDSSGNVGIGTETPSYKLDGNGDINTSTEYRVGGNSVLSSTTLGSGVVNSSLTSVGTLTGLTSSDQISINDTSAIDGNEGDETVYGLRIDANGGSGSSGTGGGICFSDGDKAVCSIIAKDAGSAGALDLEFWTGDVNSINNRMTIRSNGLIGIGTENPTSTLDVIGDINTSGGVLLETGLSASDTRPSYGGAVDSYEIRGYGTNGPLSNEGFMRLSAGGGTGSSNMAFIDICGFNTNTDMNRTIVFGTGGSEKMRLYNGNLGIGTSTPTSKLDVIGSITKTVYNSGELIQKKCYRDYTMTNSGSSSTSYTTILSVSFTPKSTNSTILAHVDAYYSINGSGTDSWQSKIVIDGLDSIIKFQNQTADGRGSSLTPLLGCKTNNTSTRAKSITFQVRRVSSDDVCTFSGSNTITIEEIQN